jgi:hypothetical protein
VCRPRLEVADIFHRHGTAWRKANAGHLSLGQLKTMSAIESCRSAALGGHVERCEDCGHSRIAYNSWGCGGYSPPQLWEPLTNARSLKFAAEQKSARSARRASERLR